MSKSLIWQVIEGARVLVGTRSTWTRYTLALTGDKQECDPTDATAVRFCAIGALVRSAYALTNDAERAHDLAAKAAMSITGEDMAQEALSTIYTTNDGPAVASRKAIVQLFDKSLERV